jgi:hypothetical protein
LIRNPPVVARDFIPLVGDYLLSPTGQS